MSAPPADIPPARLFRLLIGAPRPRLPIGWRLDVCPDVPLYVVGLRGQEELGAVDAAEGIEPTESRVSRILSELIVLSLMADGAPVFRSVDELEGLSLDEFGSLIVEVSNALSVVSPFYARRSAVDAVAWDAALETGAQHPTNVNETVLIAQAVEHGFSRNTPRPDLYWGVPLCQLTDGQLMAYRAAREVYRKLTNG